jgi:hypothetical protein
LSTSIQREGLMSADRQSLCKITACKITAADKSVF